MDNFYAHSVQPPANPSEWEVLFDHLRDVSQRTRDFAAAFDAGDWGELAGWWHDLGKYQPDFQRRLRGERIQVPHAGAGARLAVDRFGQIGKFLAFVIAGHHTGLANHECSKNGPTPLKETVELNGTNLTVCLKTAPAILIDKALPQVCSAMKPRPEGLATWEGAVAFFIRMLFSALVDADRLATEEFYDRAERRPIRSQRLCYDSLTVLRDRLDAYVDRFAQSAAQPLSPVNLLRADVLNECRTAAEEPPGYFSLTVPTGGGKTLAGMSFALRHAVRHNLRRVVMVIPFTSIIEQNAEVYRKAFGVDGAPDERNVLEHHSGLDSETLFEEKRDAEIRRRLAAENWDAPIIVTTTVQLFESLASNHPSRCRKLHRLANSVILLDEVQTLPPGFLYPILESLRGLVGHYGCSVVLSTATPPALTKSTFLPRGLPNVRPIIRDSQSLFASPAARRVTTEWRIDRITPYAELAEELGREPQVLAIVHRRLDAQQLARLLPEAGRFHLSALMCPAHRSRQIQRIRERLESGQVCRVVATQLIEAGVDVDFPVVYRALAGFDSLAQSAGRCDREGRRTVQDGRPAGRFVVFLAETSPPPGTLRKAFEVMKNLLQLGEPIDLFNPDHSLAFFEQFYGNCALDAKNVLREFEQFNFANAATLMRLIQDGGQAAIAIPWEGHRDAPVRIEQFRREPTFVNRRNLQPFLVQVRQDFLRTLKQQGVVECPEDDDSIGLLTSWFAGRYHPEFGLNVDLETGIDPEVLVV